MALLGQSINPALFLQDYSGFAKAGAIQAQGMQNIGQQIQQAAGDYAANKKEAGKLAGIKKAGIADIEAALKLNESSGLGLESSLQPLLAAATDPNSSLMEQAAVAQQASSSIANLLNTKFKVDEMNMQRQAAAQSGALNAAKIAEIGKDREQSDILAQAIGPALFETTMAQLPAGMRDSIAAQSVNLAPQQKFALAQQLTKLIPEQKEFKAPTIVDIPVPGGTQKAQFNPATNSFEPIRVQGSPQVAQGIESAMGQGVGFTPTLPQGFRPTTPEETILYKGPGQIDTATNKFYPLSPPSGMEVKVSPTGEVTFVQGAGVGQTKADVARAVQKQQQEDRTKAFIDTTSGIIKRVEEGKAGIIASAYRKGSAFVAEAGAPGQLESDLSRLRTDISFQTMSEMRAASPTGGAAGNMTEKEWPRFENKFGSLSVGGDPTQVANRLKEASLTLFNGVHGSPEQRSQWLSEGKITPEQNKKVDAMYIDMRNRVNIPKEGIPNISGSALPSDAVDTKLSPKAQEIRSKLGLQ